MIPIDRRGIVIMMYSSAIERCSATKKCRDKTNNETDGRLVCVVTSNFFCDCSLKRKWLCLRCRLPPDGSCCARSVGRILLQINTLILIYVCKMLCNTRIVLKHTNAFTMSDEHTLFIKIIRSKRLLQASPRLHHGIPNLT